MTIAVEMETAAKRNANSMDADMSHDVGVWPCDWIKNTMESTRKTVAPTMFAMTTGLFSCMAIVWMLFHCMRKKFLQFSNMATRKSLKVKMGKKNGHRSGGQIKVSKC